MKNSLSDDNKTNESISSRIMMIISTSIFGTVGIFVKSIALSSGEIALWRAVLAILLIGSFLLIKNRKIQFAKIKKELPILLISGIAIGINWILLFESYNYTTVSIATLSYYFAPVIVMLICPLLFKEKLSAKQIVCFIGSTLGLVLITGIGNPDASASNLKGILLGLGAAVFYATVIILNKYIKSVDGISRTLLQFTASITVLLPYVLISGNIGLLSLDTKGLICLLTVGVVHTGVTYCLYFSSLSKLSGQRAALLSYIDPLVAVILSVTLLKEPLSVIQAAGGIMILVFTLVNEIKIKK